MRIFQNAITLISWSCRAKIMRNWRQLLVWEKVSLETTSSLSSLVERETRLWSLKDLWRSFFVLWLVARQGWFHCYSQPVLEACCNWFWFSASYKTVAGSGLIRESLVVCLWHQVGLMAHMMHGNEVGLIAHMVEFECCSYQWKALPVHRGFEV